MDFEGDVFVSLGRNGQFCAILSPKSLELSKAGSLESNYIIRICYFDEKYSHREDRSDVKVIMIRFQKFFEQIYIDC